MRRSRLAFAAAITVAATMALGPAAAIGPGGWDHVGKGLTAGSASLNGNVTALNTDNPGVLYVGGNFTDAGGLANADRIAKWNGTAWSAIGGTPLTNGQVFAIAYHAGKVYVGGTFLNAGGNPIADHLAAWNPATATWESPCSSITPGAAAFGGNVNALQIINNTLWVGGSFSNGAGIARADYLLGCDLTTGAPSATVSADGAFSGPVYALTRADYSYDLFVGGGFTITEANPVATNVARYDGEGVWHALGSGPGGVPAVNTFVRSLLYLDFSLYVGTDAENIAGIPQADHVARWDHQNWHAVGSDSAGTDGWFANGFTIDALARYGPIHHRILIAAGSFPNADGTATADDIAYFDGSSWRPIGSNGAGNGPLSQHPTALAVTDGKVYVGGSFTSAGGDTLARFLASYALRLPDNAISLTSGSGYIGNGVYSTTAAGQTRSTSILRGSGDNFYVKIQNDGLVPASFKVKSTGGASGITASYFRGTVNITSDVKDGTYSTGTIDAGATILLRVRVHATKTSAAATSFLVKTSSVTGTAPDAVRAKVTTHD